MEQDILNLIVVIENTIESLKDLVKMLEDVTNDKTS